MNKAEKRQRSIRNKLMAATAMLLVASIMTVTTTYAWFTLSTAPEVQGITTTVGANGNLEIALAHPTGDNSQIGSDVGDAEIPTWVVKNLTWGNLLDLSDASYHLDEMTLLPSRLNITEGTATTPATLAGSPLKIPVYGTDGRISKLAGDKITNGVYTTLESGVSGFLANTGLNTVYGVRAVGTSSNMSPDQVAFNNALSAMNTATKAANSAVTTALNTYGAALADMAVIHASAGGNDTNDYVTYVDELRAISDALVSASDSVEQALYNALLALTKVNLPGDIGQVDGQDAYTYIQTQMSQGIPLPTVWTSAWSKVPSTIQNSDQGKLLSNAYTKWEAADADIADNKAAVYALKTENADGVVDVDWTSVSTAMSGMMDINKITISGYGLDEVMENIVTIMSSGGVTLQFNAGSGVIADMGELTGDILSSVKLSPDLMYQPAGGDPIKLGGLPVNIVTTTEPDEGALLTQTRTLITGVGCKQSANAALAPAWIDVIYAYMVDFAFRTNAANSNLLLQTEGVQRVYEDSENMATMGGGSTITFDGTFLNLDSLVSMMSGIRVVFTDTKGDEVYGIAKVHFDEELLTMEIVPVTRAVVGSTTTGDDGATVTKYNAEYQEGTAADTNVKLSADNNGNVTLSVQTGVGADNGAIYMGDHQYLVREKLTKEEADGTETPYERWTVKTAVTYTVSETVVTKTPKADGSGEYDVTPGTAQDVTYELLVNGKPVFYEDLDVDGDGDDDYYADAAAAAAENDTDTTDIYYINLAADLKTLEGSTVTGTEEEGEDGVFTRVDTTYYTDYAAAIASGHVAPKYFHVYDQDLSLEGPLHMYDYTVEGGELVFTTPLDVQAITTLDQNVATGISAMVYLDGDYVDNSDVVNSEDGISNTGALNLQFASSANLVPMENTALKNGETVAVAVENNTNARIYYEDYAVIGGDYTFIMDQNCTATYETADGTTGTCTVAPRTETYEGVSYTGYVYTVPSDAVSEDHGAITITVDAITP